jgi:C4-dicarboxylate-binding protein DctP
MSSFTPAVNGLSFPWLFDGDLGLMREALNGKPGTLLKAAIDKDTNTKTLGFIYSPFRNLVTIKPVDSVSDLHGLKLRTMESDLNVQTFRAVGADPTPIPFPEVYGALQTGVVDGFETDVVGMYSGKFQEVAKNVTISGHFNNVPLIVVNQAKWQSLSPDLQKIMEDAATEAGTLSYKRSLAEQSEYTKKLEDAGVKFHKIDISKLEQEAKAVYPEFEKKAPVTAEFVKAVQEMKKNKKE